MSRKSETIERQIQIDQRVIRPLYVVAQHPVVVGQILDHRAHTGELGMIREPFQGFQSALVFKVYPANDLRHRRRGVRNSKQILGLVNGWCRLNQNRLGNVRFGHCRGKVIRRVCARQNSIIRRHPAVVSARRVPEMMMCVYV